MYGYYPIISAILLALAFPKFNLWWLAWVALVPFFLALNRSKDWRESFACAFAFSLVFFGIDLFWVTSLTRFVGGWAVLGWICLVIFQSLFMILFSAFCFLLSTCLERSRETINFRIPKSLIIALLWTAIEWLRAWGPFGVTAGDVGYSQAQFLPLIQIASFSSVYGVSFIVVLVNAYLSSLVLVAGRNPRLKSGELFPTIYCGVFIVILLGGIFAYGNWQLSAFPAGNPLPKLALIQPNIDQMDKMNPRLVIPIYDIQEKMTRQTSAEIIVWPETAVFSYLVQDRVLWPRFQRLAQETGSWLVVGTPFYDRGKSYNSIISVSPSGEVVSRYDKEQLVPFGEYLPFRPLLYPLLKRTGYHDQDFNSNPNPQPITVGKYKVAAAVCFESTFPGNIRKRVGKDADFILLVTNDAWFNDSSAPYMHLNAGIFRAIENRKYFVQVGNTGFTAVIDPWGRLLKKSKLKEKGVTGLLTATP
jgi:apolipoprotein N-acyltransferase